MVHPNASWTTTAPAPRGFVGSETSTSIGPSEVPRVRVATTPPSLSSCRGRVSPVGPAAARDYGTVTLARALRRPSVMRTVADPAAARARRSPRWRVAPRGARRRRVTRSSARLPARGCRTRRPPAPEDHARADAHPDGRRGDGQAHGRPEHDRLRPRDREGALAGGDGRVAGRGLAQVEHRGEDCAGADGLGLRAHPPPVGASGDLARRPTRGERPGRAPRPGRRPDAHPLRTEGAPADSRAEPVIVPASRPRAQ